MRPRPLETLESGEGSQSEHNTQLSVEGEGEGSGPVGEWERERERGEDSHRPKSADSLMVSSVLLFMLIYVVVLFIGSCTHATTHFVDYECCHGYHQPLPLPTHSIKTWKG